jgi:hypothetical protein
MTGATGRPARGRRNNGLEAREFTPVGDLDPRIGEHLLDVLAIAGIAAFLQPSSDFNPIIRSTILPSRPTDQLWVDAAHAEDAKALMAQVDAEGTPAAEDTHESGDEDELDVDAAWAEIVAGFDTPAPGTGTWPASEDATSGRTGESLVWADHLRPLGGGPPAAGPRDHTLAEPGENDLDDAEGYIPPPPPPVPVPSGHAIIGVIGVVAGLILFLKPDLVPLTANLTMLLGIAGVLGGAALLVFRLRDGLNSDDDPDDGAVV